MNPEAMRPFGLSLLDYFRGNRSAVMSIIRDDGLVTPLPANGFFRDPYQKSLELNPENANAVQMLKSLAP